MIESRHVSIQRINNSLQGLDETQASLVAEEFNELPGRSPLRIAFEVIREPDAGSPLGGGVVYLRLFGLQEALILLAFATLSVGMPIVQEARTERVLEALRDLISLRAW